jgi:hypothetical protein
MQDKSAGFSVLAGIVSVCVALCSSGCAAERRERLWTRGLRSTAEHMAASFTACRNKLATYLGHDALLLPLRAHNTIRTGYQEITADQLQLMLWHSGSRLSASICYAAAAGCKRNSSNKGMPGSLLPELWCGQQQSACAAAAGFTEGT